MKARRMKATRISLFVLAVVIFVAESTNHSFAAEVKGPIKVFILAGQSNMSERDTLNR